MTHDTWDLIRDVGAVVVLQLLGSYIITRYFTTHTQTKSLVVSLFGLMVLLYFLSAEDKTISLLKKIWSYTKKEFTQKKYIKKLVQNVLIGLILTGSLFAILELGNILNLYHIPKIPLHNISLVYIFASVPIQQLFFFILPERITEGRLKPIILSAIAIPFFGMLHGYYPSIMTVIVTACTLGITSSYLVFYRRAYWASIMVHIIAGSIALSIGLV